MLTGYRTYIVAILTAVFGVLSTTDWVKFLDDPKAGWSIVAMSIVMAIMRSITSTPPTQK